MPETRLSIITKGDWTSGFHLAGVEVIQARTLDEARKLLAPILEKGEPHLVAIEEDLFPMNDKKLQRHLEEKPFPVVLPLPKIEFEKSGEEEKYVSALVRSCIGYYVKLK